MSFLPDWYSKGTNAMDSNGGFGTAAMFNKPTAQQQGNLSGVSDKISSLIAALRQKPEGNPDLQSSNMQSEGDMPQMTPYQGQQIGPNMGKVNNPNTMSPNGQIMPNWNRTYGGY
jgi:hypothetical protein